MYIICYIYYLSLSGYCTPDKLKYHKGTVIPCYVVVMMNIFTYIKRACL
jgi:hypothetical protein